MPIHLGVPSNPWSRVGDAIQEARLPLWPVRADFAHAARLSVSTVEDLEHGVPKDYSRATRAKVERALGWAPGDVDRILDGGEPTRDPLLQHVINAWPRLGTQAKAIIVGAVDDALNAL